MIANANIYPNPPIIVNHAKPGNTVVIHHDDISMIKNSNGMAILFTFTFLLKPTVKEKIYPTNIKMKAIPNKCICDTRVKESTDAPISVFTISAEASYSVNVCNPGMLVLH